MKKSTRSQSEYLPMTRSEMKRFMRTVTLEEVDLALRQLVAEKTFTKREARRARAFFLKSQKKGKERRSQHE